MDKKKAVEQKGDQEKCPKCGSSLGEVITTKTGRKLQRCVAGSWNDKSHQVEGCNFVKWLPFEPQTLEEKCPKCSAPLVLNISRFGKKMKKCSTNVWDPKTRTSSGCDYIEWVKGTTEELDEPCPQCGEKLVLFTSSSGKKLKKCSTNKWDPQEKAATGCNYVQWL